MIIELSGGEKVTIKEKILTKEMFELRKKLSKLAVTDDKEYEAVISTAEMTIIEIKKGKEKIEFTREWLENLDFRDYLKIQKAGEELVSEKK